MSNNKSVRHEADIWASSILAQHPTALNEAQDFFASRHEYGDMWPDWCGLPMAAVYAILTQGADVAAAKRIMMQIGANRLPELTAALLWSRFKAIYRFDPDLGAELMSQPMDDKIPVDILYNLPYHCVYIDYPAALYGQATSGFFAWMECDSHSLIPELRLLYLAQSQATPMSMPLTGGTLDDSLAALQSSAVARGLPKALSFLVPDAFPRSELAGAINLILYLCAENLDVPEQGNIRRSKDSFGNPKHSRTWDVGIRIGKALRGYSIEKNPKEAGGGATDRHAPRPHVRRAHWHHFWTGPKAGPRKLVLRWLPPIPVAMDENADMPSVLHLVHKDDNEK